MTKYAIGNEKLRALFAHLRETIEVQFREDRAHAGGCDGTLQRTEAWSEANLTDDEALEVEEICDRHGGYCDCEVLLNVEHHLVELGFEPEPAIGQAFERSFVPEPERAFEPGEQLSFRLNERRRMRCG